MPVKYEVHLILALRQLGQDIADRLIGAAITRLYRVRLAAGEMKVIPDKPDKNEVKKL